MDCEEQPQTDSSTEEGWIGMITNLRKGATMAQVQSNFRSNTSNAFRWYKALFQFMNNMYKHT